ncbi:hypothetical protein C1637_09770 [Chryseobacterium lactis]|uniref:Uncharacterized protein n=1 Tax=Chryseobacterium lactis TaxID=1241981 RepID=A0A3G6RFF9_CHRLC|nr:hypothetical protein [Chryseobacterium lactis]AZA82202.1 hypothetical protein EG342_09930 [Chryseobacterium lactis]AZB02583.1 hypothetical protein EG341_00785 [Chryseobacterium lactis]PNW14122.1 hypothetical protein C1637_09770 [Chryseobacterium lactis]
MTNKLETKHQEIRFVTSDLKEMKGMYLAKRLLRTWNEDFVDEDSGEVVSIERNEIILDIGTLLDNHNLQIVDFHLSSGDIARVDVSNQKRDGIFSDEYLTSTWCVTAVIGGKKKNIYMYANSVFVALDIAKDFIEQSYPGHFGIAGVKELNNAVLITNVSQENDGELKFYMIEVEIEKDEHSYNNGFIVKALNAENGKALIEAFLTNKFKEENDLGEFHLILQSAKVIPCEAVIDSVFSSKYLDIEKVDG